MSWATAEMANAPTVRMVEYFILERCLVAETILFAESVWWG